VEPTGRDQTLMCLEQINPVRYTGRPTDAVTDLVQFARPRLWRIVSAVPGAGYRRYYIHLTPPSETHRVSQVESLWLLAYYLGSVVRYRPHRFSQLLRGEYGAFLVEFIASQSEQMLYLLASEMCQREIAPPAIV
jgi:hypothetical protein